MKVCFVATLIGSFLFSAGLGTAQITPDTPGWFPFAISGLDDADTPISLAGLNESSAGSKGFVKVNGESFVDGRGRRIRWFGVNIVSGACFPDKAQAPKIAAHLAKRGVNIVRFHFLDSSWDTGLLKLPEQKEWDMEAFERWDYFVHELKQHGIYSNINLHVGRTYEGTPKNAPSFSKGLDNFHRPFIDQLKSYARTIFEHKNPYTGNTYQDEPAVGCVEINNENSLVLNPWWLLDMPDPFSSEIRHLWNDWLGGHFGSTENVQKHLGISSGEAGPNLITNSKVDPGQPGWRLDRPEAEYSSLTKAEGGAGARWTVLKAGEVAWWHQLVHGGMTLKNGQRYRVNFRARGDRAVSGLNVTVMQDSGEYKICGLNIDFSVGTDWQDYQFEFQAKDVLSGQTRLSISVGNQVGTYEIGEVSLRTVPTEFLRPGQTVEARNIPLPDRSAAQPVQEAFFRFLSDVETRHGTEIRDFLRHECKVKVPIAHSQVLFGGSMGARRELIASDFVDTHGYWEHPHFPRKPWDQSDWEIKNTSQLYSRSGGTLLEMAAQRPFGKPYTCSEYDIPAPNDFSVETWPMLAALATTQDWSGIYIFNYSDRNDHWRTDRITGYFSTLGHPAKEALMPWSSLVLRQGLLASSDASQTLMVGDDYVVQDAATHLGDLWGSWRRLWVANPPVPVDAFRKRMGLRFRNDAEGPELKVTTGQEMLSHKVEWDTARGLYVLDGINAALLLGKLGTHDLALSRMRVEVPELDGNGHGCIAIVSMDGRRLEESSKILVTALRRAENAGMGWNAARTSVGTNWGTGPALVQGLKAKIHLPAKVDWTIAGLSPDGAVKQVLAKGVQTLEISPEHHTVWYLLTR